MNFKVFILLCIFVLSRIFFINPLPVFFDSPEYLTRFSIPNYFQAISSGHSPFHAGYIILFWPIFHLASFLKSNPASAVIFVQIIFSAFAIYCFYRFIRIIANKKVALISSVIASLLPIYWIINVAIMTESTYINFFFISLFFVTISLRKKESGIFIALGYLLFSMAALTNPLVVLWIPFFLSVVFFLKKERIALHFLFIISAVIFAALINSLIISYAFHIPFQNGIYQYLFGVDIKVAPNVSSVLAILRFIRNAFIPVLHNNTTIIFIISAISLIKIFKGKKKLFIIAILWIFPIVITNQWFDPLLFGRHGAIAGFGFAFLSAIFLEKRRTLLAITIIYVLIASIPTLTLLKQPIPYLEMGSFVETLPKGLLIESHFARPQIERQYAGEIIFVNQPGWNKDKLESKIDSYLIDKKPIFVTSQALSDPYGIYSGPYLYSLSLSYTNKFELENIIPLYALKQYFIVDKNFDLTVYKISSKERSKYPDIPRLTYSRNQINYFDPIIQLWFFIDKAKIIQSHNIIKG